MTNYEKEREPVIGELEPMVVTIPKQYEKKKMPLSYKILIGLSMLVVCLIMLGFMALVIKGINKVRFRNSEYVQKRMEKYLEKRYDEEFVVKSYHEPGYDYQEYAEMIAYPKEEGEKYTFQVQGYYNKWNTMDFYDTYVTVKLKDEYEEYLSSIIGQYYDEFELCLTYNSLFVTNNLPVDTELEDLLKMYANGKGSLPSLDIIIPPEEPKENFEKLVTKLVEGSFRGSITVKHFMKREDYIEKVESEWREERRLIYFVYTALVYRDGNIEYLRVIKS